MAPLDPHHEFIPAGERFRILGGSILRTVLGLAFLLILFALIPQRLQVSLLPLYGFLAAAVVIYVFLFRAQFRRIRKSRYPGLQATEALILTAALFLTTFAGIYVIVSGENAQAFNTSLTHMSALYFTVTVFATVGFGDIVAVSDPARSIVTAQMVLGIGFLAIVAKVFTGYVQSIRRTRHGVQPPQQPSD